MVSLKVAMFLLQCLLPAVPSCLQPHIPHSVGIKIGKWACVSWYQWRHQVPQSHPPPPLCPRLSLWEVNMGEWKQEAQATVWLKRTAGIFSSGLTVPRPLFPPGPLWGYYCPLLCQAPWRNKVKLRKGLSIQTAFILVLSVNHGLGAVAF